MAEHRNHSPWILRSYLRINNAPQCRPDYFSVGVSAPTRCIGVWLPSKYWSASGSPTINDQWSKNFAIDLHRGKQHKLFSLMIFTFQSHLQGISLSLIDDTRGYQLQLIVSPANAPQISVLLWRWRQLSWVSFARGHNLAVIWRLAWRFSVVSHIWL